MHEPRPIRILINGLHAKSGGGVTYLRNILGQLAADPRLELHLFIHKDQHHLFVDVGDCVRVHLFDFQTNFFRLLLWEQAVLPILARLMGACVTFSPANFGPLAAPAPVIMLRNSLAVVGRETRLLKRLYWGGLALMTGLSLMLANRAIAVSEYARRSLGFGLHGVMDGKVTVVHHGVSPMFRPNLDITPDPATILVVADIYVQKNLHTLVEAMALISREIPECRLVIAGREVDKGYALDLKKRIHHLQLEDKIAMLGDVRPADLADYYCRCTVFVFPSTVETFGNPLLEAMACGAAIASSNTAAMPEILGDAGEYFDPINPEAMAQTVLGLLRSGEKRASLRELALRRAKLFSWARTGAATADVLAQAASARPSGKRAY